MEPLEVFEKATGKPLGTLEIAGPDDIGQAVTLARAAGHSWSRLSAEDRLAPIGRLKSLIVGAATELAALLSRENGKPYHESLLHEVIALLDAIEWLGRVVPQVTQEQSLRPHWLKHRTHKVRPRPRGVTAVLAPFNFPLLISGFDSLSALAMGSTVLLKPSEHCPLVVQKFVDLAHQAGIPNAALRVLHGGAEVGAAILDSDIDAVMFTGSIEHGRVVAAHSAERLRPFTLELGGNCPLVVLPDADLERVSRAIVYGALSNSGQSCLAVGRVLVPRVLETALAERVQTLVEGLRQGDPSSRRVELGALTTRAQVERCRDHVLEAKASGARRLGRDTELNPSGHFFPPVVLQGCSTMQRVYREETFGPVIAFVPYDDERTVLGVLNAESWGLAAYVFGADLAYASQYAEQLDFGHVIVDQVLLSYVCPEVPLSGLRMSGHGAVHGREGLLAHTLPQVMGLPTMRVPTAMEFALQDPEYAESVAKTYLGAARRIGTITRWFSG